MCELIGIRHQANAMLIIIKYYGYLFYELWLIRMFFIILIAKEKLTWNYLQFNKERKCDAHSL